MAMNDISLTTGMRKNLIQLQSTMTLLDRTQERLATGKKVNSALDNPINYFAAKGHLTRAADIAQYKDNMAEGIQTIQAANSGIKGIQALIESTRSLANSALTANPNQMSFQIKETIQAGNVVTIGTTAFHAVASATDAIIPFFVINDTDGITPLSTDLIAANLAAKINITVEAGLAGNLKALYSGDRITIQSLASDKAITGPDIVATAAYITKDTAITSERTILAEAYEGLLVQIDILASSSGYKGFNLLNNETLQVSFEGGSISVKGFSATASDLGVNTSGTASSGILIGDGTKWALTKDIKYDLNKMEKGILKLKNESLKLSLNLTAITIQQEFSVAKINLLSEGSDNLTTADTNEEGANMLMLQTRQSLGTTALSLSSQAAQSVLRLFA